jgi:hypothetical protein
MDMTDWYPIRLAPHDGTPVVLWLAEDSEPPVPPLTAGFWSTDPGTGDECWRIFGLGESPRFVPDGQIRGWKALLRG